MNDPSGSRPGGKLGNGGCRSNLERHGKKVSNNEPSIAADLTAPIRTERCDTVAGFGPIRAIRPHCWPPKLPPHFGIIPTERLHSTKSNRLDLALEDSRLGEAGD